MFNHENTLGDIELETSTVDGKRCYVTPTGEKYPSVTTILSDYKKDSIIEWRKRVGEKEANKISTQASRRGTKVHKLCEDYLNNELSTKEYTPDNVEMFQSIQPTLDEIELKNKIVSFRLENSYIGILGKTIEPIILPLGYDWKIGIALISSFAAREVFVGTLATIYSIGSEDQETIKTKMAGEIRDDGTSLYLHINWSDRWYNCRHARTRGRNNICSWIASRS